MPRVGEREQALLMRQLRVVRVHARVPDQPGQQHRQPDKAETQEPTQAAQVAAGRGADGLPGTPVWWVVGRSDEPVIAIAGANSSSVMVRTGPMAASAANTSP